MTRKYTEKTLLSLSFAEWEREAVSTERRMFFREENNMKGLTMFQKLDRGGGGIVISFEQSALCMTIL